LKHLRNISKPGESIENIFGVQDIKEERDYLEPTDPKECKLVRQKDGLMSLKNGGMLKL
jgi:hypothetical protein